MNEAEVKLNKPLLLHIHFPEECRLLKEWGNSNSLVFLDFNDEGLWLIYPRISDNKILLTPFLPSYIIELLNNNKFDEILDKMINPYRKVIEDSIQENIRSESVNTIDVLNKINKRRRR